MKLKYEKAELEVIEIEEQDIITDSNKTTKFYIPSGGADTFYSNDGFGKM